MSLALAATPETKALQLAELYHAVGGEWRATRDDNANHSFAIALR